MRVAVVIEQRYDHTPDGRMWSTGPAAAGFFERYLRVFDEVRVIARTRPIDEPPPGAVRADGPGIRFRAAPYYLGPWEYARRRLLLRASLAESLRPGDAVILRLPSQVAFAGADLLRVKGMPFAVEAVGDPWDAQSPRAARHALSPLVRRVQTREMRRLCAAAIAGAYVTRHALQRRYPPARDAYATHYSSIELGPEAFARPPRRLQPGPLQLITVGSMEHYYKGQDVLLKALRRCLDRGVDVRLTLLGDGRRRAELERLARRLELGERACFLGPAAAGAEVRGRLDEAGLFVLPSRQEGLPRALIEAMARGLPAIASRIGGVPELLSEEFLVQPGRARELAERISELALSPLLRDQSARENLLTARRYSDAESTPARDAFYRFVRRATA